MGTEALDELRHDKPTEGIGYYIKSAELADKRSRMGSAVSANEKLCMRSAKLAEKESYIKSTGLANK